MSDFGVQHVVSQVRLHHLTDIISALYYGGVGGVLDDDRYVYRNGTGDHIAVVWSDDGLVALAFSHESPRSQWALPPDERDAADFLRELPPELDSMAEQAATSVDDLATSGLWSRGAKSLCSDELDGGYAHGLEMVKGFGVSAEEALFGDTLRSNWLEQRSLSRRHGDLALRLHRQLEAESTAVVSAADEQVLMEHPRTGAEIRDGRIGDVVERLAALGIDWKPTD